MWTDTKHLVCVCVCVCDQSVGEEVVSLRLKLSEHEQALKDAMESVKSSNRTKDSMEHFIVSQRESLLFLLLDHITPWMIIPSENIQTYTACLLYSVQNTGRADESKDKHAGEFSSS